MTGTGISNAKKALLHIAKSEIGMTEPEYRSFLEGFGVATSKDLTDDRFPDVMSGFEKLGFKQKLDVGGTYAEVPANKSKLWATLRRLLTRMKLPTAYADAMARRMFGVDKAYWCSPPQLYKINGELMAHMARRKRRGS